MPNVIEIDPRCKTTPLKFLALMCWPSDEERKKVSASFFGKVIANKERNEKLFSDDKDYVYKASLGIYGIYDKTLNDQIGYQFQKSFQEAGGFESLTAADSLDSTINKIDSAIDRGAAASGLLLILIARIKKHNDPNMKASLSRAISILEKTQAYPVEFGTERNIKAKWSEWKKLAPLWSAVFVANGYPWGQKNLNINPMNFKDSFWKSIINSNILVKVIRYSRWFEEFSTTYVPPRASEPLIDSEEVIRLGYPCSAKVPLLPLLNVDEQRLAMEHGAYLYKKKDLPE